MKKMNRKSFKPFRKFNRLIDINIRFLVENDIQAIIFDMDNTAIIWHEDKVSDETMIWLNTLRDNNIIPILLTNGLESRAVGVAKIMNIDYISLAKKPSPKGYLRAISLSKKRKENCLFVGDQLLTDIRGANRVGLRSVLVNPIARQELFWTRLMRKVEKYMLGRELIYSGDKT